MKRTTLIALSTVFASVALAEERPASPRGQSAAQVSGKWLDVDYGRPLLRGRADIFGAGADYGKQVNAGAPVWRAGANQTTRLKTEMPIVVGGKKVAPGAYSVFVDLKAGAWTLILSTQPPAENYPPKDKTTIWGAYGYDPKFDVVRAPMTLGKSDVSVEQLLIDFVDVTPKAAKLRISWGTVVALAPIQFD